MNKKRTRILIIATLVVLSLAISGMTYAYWDFLQDDVSDVQLTLGQGTTLSVAVGANTADGKTLVPAGVLLGANDIESAVFNYTASLSKTVAEAASLSVEVVAGSVKINGATTYASLVDITINAPATITDTAAFTVTVTLTEPANQTEYDAIYGQTVTFDLNIIAA